MHNPCIAKGCMAVSCLHKQNGITPEWRVVRPLPFDINNKGRTQYEWQQAI